MRNFSRALKTRKEKVQFLTDLKNGCASVSEINPIKITLWKIENGHYINIVTGQVFPIGIYESQTNGCTHITLNL